MKILIVDDSSTMRRIIAMFLQSGGYTELDQASNGREALTKLSDVGLILTDWRMPEMDGPSFVAEVRKLDEMKDVPIIMITTEDLKNMAGGVPAGVTDFVVKPFDHPTLLGKVEEILKGGK